VSDYGYLNARVRAMSTQLLSARLYDQLLAAPGEEEALDILHGTVYDSDLVQAFTTGRGTQAIESALGRNLSACFARLLALAAEEPRRLLTVQLSRWDAEAVIAILRGKATAADPSEIRRAILPCGLAGEAELAELASAPDLAGFSAALAAWGYPFASRLRRTVAETGWTADLPLLESAVNDAWFAWALEQLDPGEPQEAVVLRMVRLQVDLANVKSALDGARHRAAGEPVADRAFLAGGLLDRPVLRAAARAPGVVEAFEALEGTYFSAGIEKGILAFGMTGSLGAMERFLEGVVIGAGWRLFRSDPLGIGVALGFLWRKYSEFLNLRLLLRGKAHAMPLNAIREELLYA
jgi:vacuolar-type H+-ATPase subunit C/Vma6